MKSVYEASDVRGEPVRPCLNFSPRHFHQRYKEAEFTLRPTMRACAWAFPTASIPELTASAFGWMMLHVGTIA